MRLLILCTSQFGYHSGTYYYCKYGRAMFEITYMGFAAKRLPMTLEGVRIKPISYRGNKIVRFMRWCANALWESRRGYDVVFIKYFPGCSLLRLLAPGRRFVFDIRTGSVQRLRWKRWLADRLLTLESKAFAHVTIISESLACKLGLAVGRYHVLPLGADVLATNDKQFDALRLLYVGTLSGREIDKTICGFAQFYQRHRGDIEMSYTIAGDGYRGELDQLRKLVAELELDGVVEFLGYVNHADLAPFWRDCNVGVSFIPINEIYDVQPPTKTFEYLLAGMPVIATGTAENRRIVSGGNGVVIPDTADGFAEGLEQVYLDRAKFTSAAMRQSAVGYQWKEIIETNLCPYLNSVRNGDVMPSSASIQA